MKRVEDGREKATQATQKGAQKEPNKGPAEPVEREILKAENR